MEFLKRLTVLFIVTVVLFIGCSAILFVSHSLSLTGVQQLFTSLYTDEQLRILLGSVSAFILLLNFFLYSIFSVNVHRDKVIAFDNPSGRVSVSLMAIEDLIKRILGRIPEVKDSKISIRAAHRKLHVRVKLSLMSDVNIPGLTSRVQDSIVNKVQDTIGLEKKVDIQIFIGKISSQEYREQNKVAGDSKIDEQPKSGVPYHGYRA